MVLRIMVGGLVLNLVSVYAPQVGRPMEEKEEFYICVGKILNSIKAEERVVVCGDLNGHVGAVIDGYEGVHGGHGFGSRNTEGEMVLEFADAMDLAVLNTWFKKEEGKLVTYESGGCRTVVDYIMVRKSERKMVRNITVLQGESCLQQHKLLVCMLEFKKGAKRKKEAFVSRCKVWKLKDEKTCEAFKAEVEVGFSKRVLDGNIDTVWRGFKDCLLEAAEETCGKTKGNQRHSETWWWNDEVAEAIKEKQQLYKIYVKSKKEVPVDRMKIEACRTSYQFAKCAAKKAVAKAQEEERKRFGKKLDEEDGKGAVF